MTDAGNEAGDMFDPMLDDMDAAWGNIDSQDPLMFQTEMDQEDLIDPALFAESLVLPDIYSAALSVPGGATSQEGHTDDPFAITSFLIPPAESVGTPHRQQASNTAALLNSSPTPAASTPTRSPRGHYGSARRRRAVSNNFQLIAPTPRREATQPKPEESLF